MLPALAASLLMLGMVLLAFGKRPKHVVTVCIDNSRKHSLMRDLDGWHNSKFASFSDYLADKRA